MTDRPPEWLIHLLGQGMSADPRLVPGFRLPEGPAYADATPTPRITGNLPPPRAMPYPEGAGREVEPDLYLMQPWGPYTKSLPGARGWEGADDADFAMRQRRMPPGGLF